MSPTTASPLTITHKLAKITLALALLAGGTAALAQPAANPGDALKGPQVPERNTPGGSGSFGEQRGELARRTEVPLPFPAFMRMVRETLGPDAPEALRLSQAQQEQVQEIAGKHGDAMRAFMNAHKDEIQALIKEHPEAGRMLREFGGPGGPGRGRGEGRGEGRGRGPGGPPVGDPMQDGAPPAAMSEKDRAAVLAKVQELRAQAPKAEDAQTAVWGALTEPQQKAVQVKVDDFKAKETARRDERYKEQQKKRFEEGRGQDKKPGGGKAPAKLDEAKRAEVLASLPQQAQDRLGKLPAEQQDRLLARLAELPADRRAEALKRMAERGRGGQGRGGQGRGGEGRGPQPGSDEQPK